MVEISNVRLMHNRKAPHHALAYFDVMIPGVVEIKRCRLVREGDWLRVRGPSFDMKRNNRFGEVRFQSATYRAILNAVTVIYEAMGGDADEEDQPAAPPAENLDAVIRFLKIAR